MSLYRRISLELLHQWPGMIWLQLEPEDEGPVYMIQVDSEDIENIARLADYGITERHVMPESHSNTEPDIPEHSPVVLAHVIAEAIRDLAEDSHHHVWDILEVWNPPVNRPLHPLIPASLPKTIVLIRCQGCNLPSDVELTGDWTREQIRAELDEPINR